MRLKAVILLVFMFMVFQAHAGILIKKSEAALPAADEELVMRGISRGPGIKLISPTGGGAVVSSPFLLKLEFEPHGGTEIDSESVQVVYLKSPPVDLTDRIKKGLTKKGIELPKAEAPPGEHHLRVRVMDSNGQSTSSDFVFRVAK